MTLTYNDLAHAASANDEQADGGVPFESLVRSLDLDPIGLVDAAQQRALRMIIAMRSPEELERLRRMAETQTVAVENLTSSEASLAAAFGAAWVDAAVTIRRAMQDTRDKTDTTTYLIRRFCFNDEHPDHQRVMKNGLTLAEARAWCQREDTHGDDDDRGQWFDGYDREQTG